MKALIICPSKRPAVPLLMARGPLATLPVLGASLISHWVENLAAQGAKHIQVICADDEDRVRTAVGVGSQWGVRIEMIARSVEPTQEHASARYHPGGESDWLAAPHDVVPMSHLPGCPTMPLFESYASWYAALLAWLPHALTPTRMRVTEIRPGVWVGSRSRISPAAELISPCWIGDQVSIEAGAVVGPGAIVEDRSVVGEKAKIAHSWVGPDTFVGAMTSVASSLAWGSTLIDWRTDSALHVPDPFLLSSLVGSGAAPTTDRFGRALPKKYPPTPAGLIPDLRSPIGSPANLHQHG
jgi:hypothetical protein